MKLITQPKNSYICCHCCIAMITGKKLNYILACLPDFHKGTRLWQVKDVLNKLDINCKKFERYNGRLPKRGLVRMRIQKLGHMVVHWDGKIYDPEGGINPKYPPKTKITHVLEIL